MVMYGVEAEDIRDCKKCGATVWPWFMRCEGCGDPRPFEAPIQLTHVCSDCGKKYPQEIDAFDCCLPKEEEDGEES